jgi:hypothetical protein
VFLVRTGTFLVVAILLLSPITTADALAQYAFETLPQMLEVGQEVKVRDETGRTTRGRVVSISDKGLIVARRQYPFPQFRPRKEETFAKGAIERIDKVDSAWNGAAIGAGISAAVLIPPIWLNDSASRGNQIGVYVLVTAPLLIASSAAAGGAIDSLFNETVYEPRSEPLRIAIAPLLERDRKGVVLQLRF